VDNGDEDYPNVTGLIRMLFMNFRTALGDIQLSKYDKWLEKDED
jgi:hypothetical protein